MKILVVASECVPFAKSGGLADVIGALPKHIRKRGHDVRIVLPKYKTINSRQFGLKPVRKFSVQMGGDVEQAQVYRSILGNVTVYFIGNKNFFDRDELYRTSGGDYHDNAQRFIFFSKAVMELAKAEAFKPRIIHCNDWQTGLIPAYIKTLYNYDSFFSETKTVYTIHNLAYQGLFPKNIMPVTGIGWDQFTPDKMEYWGQVSFMKAGLVYSDIITTVSKTYSREIQSSKEFGRGMEGVLASRFRDIYGILNGVDYEDWNPSGDTIIASNYSLKDVASGKAICKNDLARDTGLSFGEDIPFIAMISRLDPQKGFDIVVEAIESIMSLDIKFILLGRGDEIYHKTFEKISRKHPEKVSVHFTFNDSLAHKIYAGADMLLMPSHFEPCGLGQLIAFKYGTIPIVYKTGGLADTVNAHNSPKKTSKGFIFDKYTPSALLDTVKKAIEVYADKKKWKKLVNSAMRSDFSWDRPAAEYEALYKKLASRKRRR
ncbi:MAG: glycogen synthase GlgA [bacterium]